MRISRLNRSFKQKGIALITVMLVLAVVGVALMSMSSERQMDTRRTENQLRALQAWQAVYQLEAQAASVLQADALANKYDALSDNWNKPLKAEVMALGDLKGTLTDLQGRINLNNLIVDDAVDADTVAQLKRLFTQLKLKPNLVDALVDWVDKDMAVTGTQGAEDDYYSKLKPPYRSANNLFADVSELLKVRGITAEVYSKIQPYIYVASGYASLNINTASAEVLRTLAPDIKKKEAESIYNASGKPFKAVDEFLADEAMSGIKVNKDHLTVVSQYFLLSGQIAMGKSDLIFQSQLIRDNLGKVSVIKRLRRS